MDSIVNAVKDGINFGSGKIAGGLSNGSSVLK